MSRTLPPNQAKQQAQTHSQEHLSPAVASRPLQQPWKEGIVWRKPHRRNGAVPSGAAGIPALEVQRFQAMPVSIMERQGRASSRDTGR